MRRNKLRSFIIVSLVVHFIVLFIFVALFLTKNVITNHNPAPISFGVVTNNNRLDQIGVNSLNSLNNENTKHMKPEDDSELNKLSSFKKRDEKTKENLTKNKQQKESIKKVGIKNYENKSLRQSKLSPKSDETKIEYSTHNHSPSRAIEQNSELQTAKIISIENTKLKGTGNQTLMKNMEQAYPDYKLNPKPQYPMIARRRGYEGSILLKVFVLEGGSVGKIELKKSSGYGILDQSALEAVKDWIFIPGKKNGEAISSWVTVPIKFQLNSG